MPLYTPDDKDFDTIANRFRWFENVLAVEYGEVEIVETIPDPFNWILLLPLEIQLGLDEADCSLAYVGDQGYTCTVWDVTGPDDLPWATFLVDDLGPRLLPEYSLLKEEAEPEELEAILQAAAEILPARLLAGEFQRHGVVIAIPDFLLAPPSEE
jgi:hypothetical protein